MQIGSVTFRGKADELPLLERGYRFEAVTPDESDGKMRRLLIRAALDILMLENRVYELETQCKIPDAKRFSVRHPNHIEARLERHSSRG